MLTEATINEIASRVARTRVNGSGLERVLTEAATDSEGHDALRITLVLKPAAVQKLTGDEALDLLVGIQQGLRSQGEHRFPIVEYATEKELEPGDDQDEADSNEDDA